MKGIASARLSLYAACICISATAAIAEELDAWRSYEVYQPTVERHYIIDARAHAHKYNHCSTIAWFQDRWFCLWGSHIYIAEHTPGQRMVVSTSRDGRTWTPIERVFSSDKHSVNPVAYPEGKGHQWQPNLGLVNGELWALWNQGGSAHDFRGPKGKRAKDLRGLYFSRLKRSDGKWTNRLLKWDGQTSPVVDGVSYSIASTQNLYRLRSGRVLAPVTLYATRGPAADAPKEVEGWWGRQKRNSVIYTDDLGETWHLSPGCMTPGFSWIQWEPTVWEQPDGSVMMFARNNTNWALGHNRPTSGQFLLWSISRDGGETWAPHGYVPLETICSRMHVAPVDGRGVWLPAQTEDDFTGRRMVMVHNDAPGGIYSWSPARVNLALFSTRGAGFDFVAGNSISFHDPRAAYPQMWRHGDTMAVSYTESYPDARSIRVALISPLPRPDRYYLFPRFNDVPAPAAPRRIGNVWRFADTQHIATRQPAATGEDGFSFGAWIRSTGSGMLLDTRGNGGGFCIMLRPKETGGEGAVSAPHPVACVCGKPHVFGPNLHLGSAGGWHYIGLTVNKHTGEAVFYVDGKSEAMKFTLPKPHRFSGVAPHLGGKSLRASGVRGLTGDVRFAALYAGPVLGTAHHRRLYNRFAEELGRPKLDGDAEPAAKPVMWMDAADADAFNRDFAVPTDEPRGGSEMIAIGNRDVLRIRDEGSVGVDLDENHRAQGDRVRLRFRFQIERGDELTLCTVGDFNQPVRLVARQGQVVLCAGDDAKPCGPINRGGWTCVSLETGGDTTRAQVGDGPSVDVKHQPEATWLYLGEGFPRYGRFPGTRLLIDVPSVRSQVVRGSVP